MKRPPTSIHIDRLDLDFRGVSPATAEAAIRQLAPALQQALAQRDTPSAASDLIRIHKSATSTTLATQIATRLASITRNPTSEL